MVTSNLQQLDNSVKEETKNKSAQNIKRPIVERDILR